MKIKILISDQIISDHFRMALLKLERMNIDIDDSNNLDEIANNERAIFINAKDYNALEEDEIEQLAKVTWVLLGQEKIEAYRAIKNNATDYLLIPINETELIKALDKCDARLSRLERYGSPFEGQVKTVSIKLTSGKSKKFDFEKIIYFESNGDLSYMVFQETPKSIKRLAINSNIGALESIFLNKGFFRIHRKYLVNKDYVEPYGAYPKNEVTIQKVDKIIPLARRRKLDFHNWYKGHFGK